MAEQRAARLAAIEARLAGQAQSPASPSTNADTATVTSKGAAAKPKEPTWQPTEKGDLEKKKEFTKLLYRGIVRDNGYREASGCVDTLIKISSNILANPSEAKFRELKALNPTIKSKILDIKSGHDFLILLGFRTRTVAFEKQYILESSLRRLHDLKLGNEVLSEAADELRSRVSTITTSTTNHQSEEASRRARALAEYEADRDIVKERVKREKFAREAREQKAKEAAEAAANGEPEPEFELELQGGGGGRLDGQNLQHEEEDDDDDVGIEEEDEDEEDDEEDENGEKRYLRSLRRSENQRWGQGQTLGN